MVGDDCRKDELIDWLEGDPSIRWRVHRDLLDSSEATVRDERAKVATAGWGAKLISLQDHDGRWGGGDYTPKWISTTYTLHLIWLGLPPGHPRRSPGVSASGSGRADGGCRRRALPRCWRGSPPLTGTTPNVSTASSTSSANSSMTAAGTAQRTMTLPSTAPSTPAFRLLRRLTSINVLAVRGNRGGAGTRARFLPAPSAVQVPSHRPASNPRQHPLPQLPQWHFDVLRGLERFVDVAADRDRLGDAVGVLLRARRADGRWPTYAAYPATLGSRWRNRVRAGGTRYERCAFWWWGRPGTSEQRRTSGSLDPQFATPPMPPPSCHSAKRGA